MVADLAVLFAIVLTQPPLARYANSSVAHASRATCAAYGRQALSM